MIEPEYAKKDVNGKELSEKQKKWLENNGIELNPFDKRNWKTAESRDNWKSLMRRAADAKMEAEWRSVREGSTDRKAAIIHIYNNNREEWLKRLSEEDLVFRDIRYTEPYGGFSHKTFPTDKNDPERVTYAVIAQNSDIADKMEEAENGAGEVRSHEIIGELLGFPKCCRDFFNEYFIEKQLKDPMYEIACNTEGAEKIEGDAQNLKIPDPYPKVNPIWRYFGWGFITHLPCSFKCEHSRDVAEKRKQIMIDNGYRDAVEAMEEWLNLPAEWTAKAGLMHIVNKHFIGSARGSDYWSMKRILWKKKNLPGGSILDD